MPDLSQAVEDRAHEHVLGRAQQRDERADHFHRDGVGGRVKEVRRGVGECAACVLGRVAAIGPVAGDHVEHEADRIGHLAR